MLKLDDFARIRQAHREWMSIRGLANLYHHPRRPVAERSCHWALKEDQ